MSFFEDHAVGIVTAVMVILAIGFIGYCTYCVWADNDAGESVILRDGNQSYSCVVSRVDQTPHDCKPIKDGGNDH